MVIDLIVASLVLLSLFRGWVRGFLFQCAQAAWLFASFLVARLLGPMLESTGLSVGIPAHFVGTVAFGVAFVGVFWMGSHVIYKVTREFHESVKSLTRGDRLLGLLLGGLRGGFLVYISFVVLIMAHRLTGNVPVPYATSQSGRWVMEHNFLDNDEFPRARALKAIVTLGYLTVHRDTAHLITNPHFRAILTHPKAECLHDPEVMGALLRQDWVEVLSNEEIWDLLDEPDIQEHLNAIESESVPEDSTRSIDEIPKIYLKPSDLTN